MKLYNLFLMGLFLTQFSVMRVVGQEFPSKIELKVVQEKEFKKAIEKVTFAEETKNGRSIFYPKIIVFKKEIEFLDVDANVLARVPKYGPVHISKQGKFVGIEKWVIPPEIREKYGDDAYQWEKSYLEVYNDRGEKIWKSKNPIASVSEESYEVYISDSDGSAVVNRIEYGGIDFYNSKGERKIVEPFGRVKWARRNAKGEFSGDGEYFAIVAGEHVPIRYEQPPGESTNPMLILYKKDGIEVWRKPIDEYIGGAVFISSHGKYMFTRGHTMGGIGKGLISKTAYIFDNLGNICTKYYNQEIARKVWGSTYYFTEDEKYLAVSTSKTLYLIKLNTGETILEKKFDYFIDKMLVSSQDKRVLIEIRPPIPEQRKERESPNARRELEEGREDHRSKHDHAIIYICNFKGEILAEIFVDGIETPGQFNSYPVLQAISNDGKQLGLHLDKKVKILERR